MDGLIPQDKKDALNDHLGKIYVFVLMWSIGALLELEDRRKLQEFLTGIPPSCGSLFAFSCLNNKV